MAAAIAKEVDMMATQRMFRCLLSLVFFTTCTGCQLVDSSYAEMDRLLEKQIMVIGPYSDEYVSRYGAGFVIRMKQDVAIKIGAPRSVEFKKALEEQLQKELTLGHVYCPSGYKIESLRHYLHYYTTIDVNCTNAQINGVRLH